ncbi:nuclear transport factor 2 family protein [Ilumatobacter sp.]|uniref:nuclear transport factor 2 family protein n=1 Tax=Ilumatobacter sp. TaxID=1967498 RepID=UPI003B52877D
MSTAPGSPPSVGDATVRALLDERDVVAVAHRYCRALDTRDWDLLDEVFVPGARADLLSGHVLEGRDAIKARVGDALGRLDASQHLVGNHEVTVDGDTAVHRCYLQAQHVRRDALRGPNYIVAGGYEDELVRTEDGWRIAFRRIVVTWTDGDPSVARGD